ncbi:MAG: DUF4198 domain-containing protein [Pseudomonadota bacterium]
MKRAILAATLASFVLFGKGQAHEFWIDALDYAVPLGNPIAGDLLVGQEFSGAVYSYIPRSFTRFEVWMDGDSQPVVRRLGDRPALVFEDLPDGLAIVAHETTATNLTYTEWDRFVRFAEHKDFGDIAAMQDARGLPRTNFVESYTRHAKSLIAVGDGAGADTAIGLTIEIVALANPYTDDVSEGLPVLVQYQGRALPDVQVELFDRGPDGAVTITLHRTDADGVAMLPVAPGHEYLADHVVLEPLEPSEDGDPVWHTYWASLTFAVPG